MSGTTTLSSEKSDLLAILGKHRYLFRHTVSGLTDEQAALTPTVSELCLGGLIKHVAFVETGWIDMLVGGSQMEPTEDGYAAHLDSFRMLPGETLEGILAAYDEVAARTTEVVTGLESLDATCDLPDAPWFTEKAWSARRVLVHIVAETAQHAGHADIIRETIDGQKSMG